MVKGMQKMKSGDHHKAELLSYVNRFNTIILNGQRINVDEMTNVAHHILELSPTLGGPKTKQEHLINDLNLFFHYASTIVGSPNPPREAFEGYKNAYTKVWNDINSF